MGERLVSGFFIAALVCVGAMSWWFQLRGMPSVDAEALAALPPRIGVWDSFEVPMEPRVEEVLQADLNVQRSYQGPTGDLIWLYIGYYGTARRGRPEHNPSSCYTGAGWNIEATRQLAVSPEDGFRVNEYRVARGGERRLVHFWYRSHRRTGMLGGLDQNFDRMIGRLFFGRADGALVRLSTPFQAEDEVGARSRLMSFAASVDPLIAERWPKEE